MSLQIQLKKSAVSQKQPFASDLAVGELALNYNADGPFLTCKDTEGNVRKLNNVWVAAAAPTNPTAGDLWLDTNLTTAVLKVYKDSTSGWVNATTIPVATTSIFGTVRLATSSDITNGTSGKVVDAAQLQSKITDLLSNDVVLNGDLEVNGDLTVNGTTTTIDTETLIVEDKNIEMGVVATPTDNTADGGGITLKGATDKTLNWVNATDSWTSSENLDLASGKSYRINGTEVLSATALGSAVQISSANIPSGTIVDSDINAAAEIAVSKLADGDARQLLQTDAAGTGVEWTSNVDVPGTLDVTGAATFDSSVSVTGALTKSGNNVVTVGDTGTVTSTMIANNTIVNEDINASAAIADTKLDTISTAGKVSNSATTATSANTASAIVARDASGNFTAGTVTASLAGNADTATKLNSTRTFAVTGDVTGTVSSDLTSGATIATSIASGVIVDADINASAEIAVSKLADGDARQLLQTDAAGTGVEWTSNVDVPGTLDVTGAATFDSSVAVTGTLTKSGNNVVTVGDTGTVTSTMILDGTIVNGDVNASAAIAGTKISPDFGSQNVVTTGTATAAALIPSGSSVPTNGVYLPSANNVAISTNGTGRVEFGTSEVVFNDGGADYDFRIEGATRTSLFFVDASTDRVGINNGSPGSRLTVKDTGTSSSSASTLYLRGGINNTANDGPSIGFSNTQDAALNPMARIRTGLSFAGAQEQGWFAIDTNGTERFRVTETGLISIGGDTNTGFSNPSADNIAITTGGSERARIDSSGRLLVGTSSSLTDTFFQSLFQLAKATSASLEQGFASYFLFPGTPPARRPIVAFNRSRGTSLGVNTAVASGDFLGSISFNGAEGTNFLSAADITAQVDSGTISDTSMPGRLVFSTTADGASSPTERMRITSDAYVRLASGTGGIQFNGDTAAANALDDYEEGTFSPNWSFAGGGSATRFFFSGAYTKIGNTVYIRLGIGTSSINSPSGAATITGLPFSGAGGTALGGLTISRYLKWKTDMPNLKAYVSGTSIVLNKSASTATALAPLEGSDFLNFANYNNIYIAGSYNVA